MNECEPDPQTEGATRAEAMTRGERGRAGAEGLGRGSALGTRLTAVILSSEVSCFQTYVSPGIALSQNCLQNYEQQNKKQVSWTS